MYFSEILEVVKFVTSLCSTKHRDKQYHGFQMQLISNLSIRLSRSLSMPAFVSACVYLSVCQSVFQSVCLSVFLTRAIVCLVRVLIWTEILRDS